MDFLVVDFLLFAPEFLRTPATGYALNGIPGESSKKFGRTLVMHRGARLP
jgi:hypothetical protein